MEAVLTQRPDWCTDPEKIRRDLPNPPRRGARHRASGTNCAAATATRWRNGNGAALTSPISPNAVFERVPLLRDWLRVTIPTPGAYDTINRGPTSVRDDQHPYEQRFGAALRIITDMAMPEQSRMIAAPGQSGNSLSSHYADLLARWRAFDWLVPDRAAAVGDADSSARPMSAPVTAPCSTTCGAPRRQSPEAVAENPLVRRPLAFRGCGLRGLAQAREPSIRPARSRNAARSTSCSRSTPTGAAPRSSRCRPAIMLKASPITRQPARHSRRRS